LPTETPAAAARALALAAAQRVVDRFFATPRTLPRRPQPAGLARLAAREQFVLGIAHLADGGETLAVHHPHFGGLEAERDVAPSRATTCACCPAARASWPPLPSLSSMLWTVVPRGSRRGAARSDARVAAGTEITLSPCFKARRVQDVALLAVA
jgi:hypothetical protein